MTQQNLLRVVYIATLFIVVIFGVISYQKINKQQKENALLGEHVSALQNTLEEKEKQLAASSRQLEDVERQLNSCRNYNRNNYDSLRQESQPAPEFEPSRPSNPSMPSNPAPHSRDDSVPLDDGRKKAINEQVSVLYDDLIKDLNLPEESTKKLIDHFSNSMKSEMEFGAKLMDPNASIDDLLKMQESLTQRADGELDKFLSPIEKDKAKAYQNNLPQNSQKKHFAQMVDQMAISDEEKARANAIIERAVEQSDPKKNFGNLTREDIVELREKLAGKKPGSPEFMQATLEMGETEVKKLLDNLQELPKQEYEILKEQIEMPLKMMRESMKHQGPPPGAPSRK